MVRQRVSVSQVGHFAQLYKPSSLHRTELSEQLRVTAIDWQALHILQLKGEPFSLAL